MTDTAAAPVTDPDYELLARALREMATTLGDPLPAMRHLLKQAFRAAAASSSSERVRPGEFRARVNGWTTHDSTVEISYLPGLDLLTLSILASPLPRNGGPLRWSTVKRDELLTALRALPSAAPLTAVGAVTCSKCQGETFVGEPHVCVAVGT